MDNFESNYRDNDSESIGLLFVKTYNLWHKSIKEKLSKLGLTHPQFVVLASLGYLAQNNDEVNQIAISKQSDIDVMTTSIIIKNLEKMKLITRQESKKDTRSKAVHLTNVGQLLLNRSLPIIEKIDCNFFGLLESDQELFKSFLKKLIKENIR